MFRLWTFLALCPSLTGVCLGKNYIVEYAEPGDNVTLACPVDRHNPILNVNWHRENFREQIVRYDPANSEHVRVSESAKKYIKPDDKALKLTVIGMNLSLEGVYKCEILWPNYRVDVHEIMLKLVELPSSSPIITGVRPRYTIGETVNAECLSDASNPPAKITWYINGGSVNPDHVRSSATTSSLSFNVTEAHLHGTEERALKLMCSVRIEDVYWRTSVEEVAISSRSHDSLLPDYLPAMFSGGCQSGQSGQVQVWICLLLLAHVYIRV